MLERFKMYVDLPWLSRVFTMLDSEYSGTPSDPEELIDNNGNFLTDNLGNQLTDN